MSELVLRALDGGVALSVETAGRRVADIRIGWRAALRLGPLMRLAAELSPPWRPEGSDDLGGWTDQGLEVFRERVEEPEGLGRSLEDQIFVTLTGEGCDAGVVKGAAPPVFASHLKADGGQRFGYDALDRSDAGRVAVECGAHSADGGLDRDICPAPEISLRAVAAVRNDHGEALLPAYGDETEGDAGHPDTAGAARCGPKDVDEGGPKVGQDEVRHDGHDCRESSITGSDNRQANVSRTNEPGSQVQA